LGNINELSDFIIRIYYAKPFDKNSKGFFLTIIPIMENIDEKS